MIKIRKFKAEDAEVLCPSAVDASLHGPPGGPVYEYWRVWARINAVAGPAYTGYDESGQVLGAAGIRIVREGVGNVWAVFSPDIRNCKTGIYRALKRMMQILIKDFEFIKLRTDSRKGFEVSQRFLEHLGFKRLRREKEDRYYYILRT